MPGVTFLTFEGIDGCGKTTQVARLLAWLAERAQPGAPPALHVREPGGSPVGERIRALVLDRAIEIGPAAEALLYAASRAELVRSVIVPALADGRTVVADRFLDSSLAYQAVARGLGFEEVLAANRLAVGACVPDLTVLLRIAPSLAATRRAADKRAGEGAGDDRIEAEGVELQARVAQAYDELAERWPERIRVVDASGSVDATWQLVREAVAPVFGAAAVPA